MAVAGDADDAPGDGALIGVADGQEGGVGTAEAEGNAEALGAADDEELKEGSDVDDANTLVDAELMLTIDDDVDVTLAEEAEL